MILLLDNYDSFTYNLYQYLEELGARTRVFRHDAITLERVAKLKPAGIVISPGPGTPDEAGLSMELVARFSGEIPILGVCLGHQSIAQVFGGRIVRAPKLMHGKISDIRHDGKGVFKGLKNPFEATRYHSLIVERKSLPKCLEVTAEADNRLIMGLRHRTLPVEGVQFHPESFMTGEGKKLLKNFLKTTTSKKATRRTSS